jgi:ribonucleoside-triphosphate reductase
MSLPQRARGVKVLKAVSSPLRLQILNLLFDKGELSYTELMNQLKMNPSRDAGRFAYHLKFLLKANLVEVDSEAKKYFLTDLGKMVIDVADRVEKKAVKPKGMLVRTSHFTFEEFDANKIANSLIRESKMPADLAQKTAKETEKLLVKSKIKYLTAALIREIVNVLLIEKGLEDYRHKLTRLGLPVHEVAALIDAKTPQEAGSVLAMAGKTVFREYTLLNVLPRDISDAHLSGALHINGLSTWILKPSEIMHDLRFFLQNGMRLDDFNPQQQSKKPPKSFEAALATTFDMLLFTQQEVNETQTIDHFNVFLAPFITGLDPTQVKENLRLFILNLNQHADVSLGLEPQMPSFLANKPAVGPNGKTAGNYSQYTEEAKLLAELTVDIFTEESVFKPIVNPKLILKVTPQTATEQETPIFQKATQLAFDKSPILFANELLNGETASFSASGIKLKANLTGDWETDTMRTGCLGCVTINLPRIVRECEKDKTKFFNLLKERAEMAVRALGIKQRALKQFGKTVLPFLMHGANGDTYFRLENCSGIVNVAGFESSIENFTSKPLGDKESIQFAVEVLQNMQGYISKLGRKHGKRISLAIVRSPESSGRLAQLDVEKYGLAKVNFLGTREKPYYTTAQRMTLQTGNKVLSVPTEQLELHEKTKGLSAGANLTIIDIDASEENPDELMKLTLRLMQNHGVELLTYNRSVTYCKNCQKSWFGNLHRCPSCGAIGTLVEFNRFSNT